MIIKTLDVRNFRSHARYSLRLGEGVNILVGDNARGKTNLVEAIYFACVGRGFRSPRDRDVIKFGEMRARVNVVAAKKSGEVSVEIVVANDVKKGSKQIKINETPVMRMGELMGTVTCVLFTPDELRLIKEAPSDRRRFMDIGISQMDRVYFYSLLKYNKILQQRNALLKTIDAHSDMRMLDIWDEQLAAVGAIVVERRLKFAEHLRCEIGYIHKGLTGGKEDIEVRYCGIDNINTINSIDVLKTSLLSCRDKDMRLRTTTVGPHRDDLLITINGKDVRAYSSQGQQRTAALSLKLAELKIFEQITGESPVLLLDDVLSELDETRQRNLLKAIEGVQSVITATKVHDIKTDVSCKMFHVEHFEN